MSSSERKQATRTARTDDTDEAQGADLRDPALDEEVECCLAEIDSVLEQARSEKDKAHAEFDEITTRYREAMAAAVRRYNEANGNEEEISAAFRDEQQAEDALMDGMRLLEAQYAHLGLQVGFCCGEPRFYTDDDE